MDSQRIREPDGQRETQVTKDQKVRTTVSYHLNACRDLARSTAGGVGGSPRHFLAAATAADPKWDLWRIRWQTWHKRVAIVIGTFGDVCRLYIGFVSWIGMNSRVPGVWMCVCVWMPRPWNFIWLDRCVCVVCLWLVLLIRVFVVIFGRFCWSVWEPTVVETFNRSPRIDDQITSTTARKAAAIGTCVILIVSYCFC